MTTPSESMITRVAWAIHHDAYLQGSTHDIFDDLMPEVQQIYIRFARAALEAMRSPTEAMLDAGPPEPYMDAWVWAKMIDAALSEKTP